MKVLVLKEIFSLVIIFHICDIRVYHFDSGCGQPDIPESMDVQLSDDGGYENRCNGDQYFLDGVSRVMCDSYGKWMNEFPKCIPKSYCKTVSNDSIGDFVDIRYEYQMRAKSGQVWVPDGVSVHFSCNTIQNMTQNNETHYVLRGPVDDVQCSAVMANGKGCLRITDPIACWK